MDESQLNLTVKDIADVLGVTRGTIYNRQTSGELPKGTGIDVIRAGIRQYEHELQEINERFIKLVAERLTTVTL